MNAEAALDAFFAKHISCLTCRHCTDVDLFGATFCNVNEGMPPELHSIAQGWNNPGSCCENHSFKDQAQQAELERLQDAWYAETYPNEQEAAA